MEMAKSSTKKSVRYRQSPVITFLVVAAVIFICVTSIVRATSLHTKSKQLAETEKTMELKVEEAKQEQANLDAQEKYMQTNEYIEDVAKDKLGLVVALAINNTCLSFSFLKNTPLNRSFATAEDDTRSWESAVDMIAAKMPHSSRPPINGNV